MSAFSSAGSSLGGISTELYLNSKHQYDYFQFLFNTPSLIPTEQVHQGSFRFGLLKKRFLQLGYPISKYYLVARLHRLNLLGITKSGNKKNI